MSDEHACILSTPEAFETGIPAGQPSKPLLTRHVTSVYGKRAYGSYTPTVPDSQWPHPDQPALPRCRARSNASRAELAQIDFALPGSVTSRMMHCGNPRCRCRADPPQLHEPYLHWTRKINGKATTRTLSRAQLDRYQPCLDNAARLHHLVHELETLAFGALEDAEAWGRKLIQECGKRVEAVEPSQYATAPRSTTLTLPTHRWIQGYFQVCGSTATCVRPANQ
ncbi:DUF6788 family protein [Leekyejoonella antrihumi]|uniref:DUF6788 family protein n=1 Tax=Leekyejoonella antrihumi TaxID=1660198 RepID=UPI003CCC7E46